MKKTVVVLAMTLALAGCGSDDPNAPKSDLQKAGDSAKQTLQHLGNAWSDANKDRVDTGPKEDTAIPEQKVDMAALKEKAREAKEVVVEKSKELMQKAREMTEEVKQQ